jgi:aromatase
MTFTTQHTIEIQAPAAAVHRLLAGVTEWPRLFEPTIHVEYLERNDAAERIQIWAQANGETRTWVSRRVIGELTISFRQEVSSPPVLSMGGKWIVEPLGSGSCLVRLLHDFTAAGGQEDWVRRAVDRNSNSELAGLRRAAERSGDLLLTFADTVDIDGSVQDVYDFLNEADRWADRLPHVASVSLAEDTPGLQRLRMDTRAADGSIHTTESVRICRPPRRIYYKQLELPALLAMHVGHWELREDGTGRLRATAGHSVEIRPDAIQRLLGPDAGPAQARGYLRKILGGNSRTTLEHARAYAGQRVT